MSASIAGPVASRLTPVPVLLSNQFAGEDVLAES